MRNSCSWVSQALAIGLLALVANSAHALPGEFSAYVSANVKSYGFGYLCFSDSAQGVPNVFAKRKRGLVPSRLANLTTLNKRQIRRARVALKAKLARLPEAGKRSGRTARNIRARIKILSRGRKDCAQAVWTSVEAVPMIAGNRASCVAPCGIFFDATDPASGVIQPPASTDGAIMPNYNSQEYSWNFGDTSSSGAGTWSAGRKDANGNYPSKNTAIGYTAAHVYENPGQYTARLTVSSKGTVHNYYQEITVTSYGGRTVCISQNNNWSGCPSDAAHATSLSQAETTQWGYTIFPAHTRILLHRGETFSTDVTIGMPTDIVLGAYGTGAKPIITTSNDSLGEVINAWVGSRNTVVMDVEIRLSGGANRPTAIGVGGISYDVLILRVDVPNMTMGYWGADGLFMFDSTTSATNGSMWNILLGAAHLAFVGNRMTQMMTPAPPWNGHNIYGGEVYKGVICANTLVKGNYTNIRISSGYTVPAVPEPAGQPKSASVTITDNDLDMTKNFGGINYWMSGVDVGIKWDPTTHVENSLVERNVIRNACGNLINIAGDHRNIMIRNNVLEQVRGDYNSAIFPITTSGYRDCPGCAGNHVPDAVDGPTNVWFYGNTITSVMGPTDWYQNTAPYQSGKVWVYNNTVNGALIAGNPPQQ